MSRRRSLALAALLLFAGAPGCASRGRLLPEEQVARIEPRVTHQREVREWLGRPDAVRMDADGTARWSWVRRNRPFARGRVGRWVLGPVSYAFERYVLFPPPRDPLAGRVEDRLAIVFEPDGRVRAVDYRRTTHER